MSAGNGSLGGLSSDELRAAVRAVLRDLFPGGVAGEAATALRPNHTASSTGAIATLSSRATPLPTSQQPELVTLGSDADLDAFVRRVASLCEDPTARKALRNGQRRFRLAGPAGARTMPSPPHDGGVHRIERGAVTERAVKKAAADGGRLVVGRRAVLTPLARDKARVLGVVIERER